MTSAGEKNLGSPWSPVILYEKESTADGNLLPQQSTVSEIKVESCSNQLISHGRQSSSKRLKVHYPQAAPSDVTEDSKSSESISSGGVKCDLQSSTSGNDLPQVTHWTWTDDPIQIESNEKFVHLLPKHPLGEEVMFEMERVQLMDEDTIEKILKPVESKIKDTFVCLGKDKNKKPHKADEETFKIFGFCKKCLYEAYGELNDQAMANKQQNKRRATKKTDVKLVKINEELEKLPKEHRDSILEAINEKHRLTGEEFKTRLRGLGMGYYPENKNRKIQQFESDSVLCYYAYGLKCLTFVFDPSSKNLIVIGAPEVREELKEVAKQMKGSKNKKAKFEAGTDLIQRVLKRTPMPSPKTVGIQTTASTVWDNAFAQKPKSDDAKSKKETVQKKKEAKRRKEEKTQKKNDAKKRKTDQTEEKEENKKDKTEPSVQIFEGKVISVVEDECYIFKSCKECQSKDIETVDDDDHSKCFCPKCSKIVETLDNVLVLVRVKLNNTVHYEGNSIDEALVQLGEDELKNLLPTVDLSTLNSEELIGANVGPGWFHFDDPVWKKFSPSFHLA